MRVKLLKRIRKRYYIYNTSENTWEAMNKKTNKVVEDKDLLGLLMQVCFKLNVNPLTIHLK